MLLLPVGGTYTVDKRQAKAVAESIGPHVIVPMHFRQGGTGLEILTELDDFLEQYPVDRIRRYPSNELEIRPEMTRQAAVLKLP